MRRPTASLPPLMRLAMISAISIGAIEVCASASELAVVLNADELELTDVPLPDLYSEQERALWRVANTAMFNSKKSTLKTMNVSRSLILMALMGASSMVFLAALRVRWPNGAPRAASARLIGHAALASAVCRTLDGAQTLLLERRSAEAVRQSIEKLPPVAFSIDVLVSVPTIVNLAITALLVTVLMTLSHYFRSENVQSLFLRLDGPEPEPGDE